MGAKAEIVRGMIDAPGGWSGLLEAFGVRVASAGAAVGLAFAGWGPHIASKPWAPAVRHMRRLSRQVAMRIARSLRGSFRMVGA